MDELNVGDEVVVMRPNTWEMRGTITHVDRGVLEYDMVRVEPNPADYPIPPVPQWVSARYVRLRKDTQASRG